MRMNGGVHHGRRMLATRTLSTMFARAWAFDGSNGDTLNGLCQAWGLGNQQFPAQAVGHLGDAYGLRAIFWFDPARSKGMLVLIGGTGIDPDTQAGQTSALARFEERIVTAVQQGT